MFTPLSTRSLSSVDELYLFAWQFSRNLDDVGREWTSLLDAVAAHVTPWKRGLVSLSMENANPLICW